MTVAKQMDIRSNIKSYFDMASLGDTIFVPRKANKNVYIISQHEYESFQMAKRNAEYLQMLDSSISQINEGNVVRLSVDDLKLYE